MQSTPTSEEVRGISRQTHEEATGVIEATQLLRRLSDFGVVELEGSYVYDLMINPDIDILVHVKPSLPLTLSARGHILRNVAEVPGVNKLQMSDHRNFPQRTPGIRGVWVGLSYQAPDLSNRWNIDLWFVEKISDTFQQSVSCQGHANRLATVREDVRDKILAIKYAVYHSPDFKKGQSSADIYHAVLCEGINSTEEYLKSRQLTGSHLATTT
ncbi:hypothetical protein AB0H73_21925 [Streptomyces olivoreticuli]